MSSVAGLTPSSPNAKIRAAKIARALAGEASSRSRSPRCDKSRASADMGLATAQGSTNSAPVRVIVSSPPAASRDPR